MVAFFVPQGVLTLQNREHILRSNKRQGGPISPPDKVLTTEFPEAVKAAK